jgi:hypothetical protein
MVLSLSDDESEPLFLHVPSTNEEQEHRNISAYVGLVMSAFFRRA